jgi:hypothetical protein
MKTLVVPGTNALDELARLRKDFPQSGLYPILLGGRDDFERLEEETQDETADPQATLKASQSIDAAKWFIEKPLDDPELYAAEEGEWPEASSEEMGIVTHRDLLSGKPLEKVWIGLLPVRAAWEVFAHLNWGGWNECPSPEEHCALHRYWQSQWGAEVVSVTGDVVQCIVARPPQERAASLALAREQYHYCYDIVEQGTQSVAALAAGLQGSEYWYFWWD